MGTAGAGGTIGPEVESDPYPAMIVVETPNFMGQLPDVNSLAFDAALNCAGGIKIPSKMVLAVGTRRLIVRTFQPATAV